MWDVESTEGHVSFSHDPVAGAMQESPVSLVFITVPHETPLAPKEFTRVLNFRRMLAVIHLDLKCARSLIRQDQLLEPAGQRTLGGL
jgi:hypothetical protein